jgi:hypothetical protein
MKRFFPLHFLSAKVSLSLILLIVSTAAFWGCQKDEPLNESLLTGPWVDVATGKDTLIFNRIDAKWLEVRVERVNGLPKYNSGIFEYEIRGESIHIRSMLSSSTTMPGYYFKVNTGERKLQIGNFYKPETGANLLYFRKL